MLPHGSAHMSAILIIVHHMVTLCRSKVWQMCEYSMAILTILIPSRTHVCNYSLAESGKPMSN